MQAILIAMTEVKSGASVQPMLLLHTANAALGMTGEGRFGIAMALRRPRMRDENGAHPSYRHSGLPLSLPRTQESRSAR